MDIEFTLLISSRNENLCGFPLLINFVPCPSLFFVTTKATPGPYPLSHAYVGPIRNLKSKCPYIVDYRLRISMNCNVAHYVTQLNRRLSPQTSEELQKCAAENLLHLILLVKDRTPCPTPKIIKNLISGNDISVMS